MHTHKTSPHRSPAPSRPSPAEWSSECLSKSYSRVFLPCSPAPGVILPRLYTLLARVCTICSPASSHLHTVVSDGRRRPALAISAMHPRNGTPQNGARFGQFTLRNDADRLLAPSLPVADPPRRPLVPTRTKRNPNHLSARPERETRIDAMALSALRRKSVIILQYRFISVNFRPRKKTIIIQAYIITLPSR
jgi:hypothetical protein